MGELKKGAIIASVICLMAVVMQGTASGEVAIGAANDVIHSMETRAAMLRYDYRPLDLPLYLGAYFMPWSRRGETNNTIAMDYNLGQLLFKSKYFDLAGGAAYINKVDKEWLNGMHWNYSGYAALNIGDHFRVHFNHLSDARKRHNKGWNFLGISYRF